jgi:hypothetical protein
VHVPEDQAAAEAERISAELARRRDRRPRDKAWFALAVTIALLVGLTLMIVTRSGYVF